jgi:hypothetical protein
MRILDTDKNGCGMTGGTITKPVWMGRRRSVERRGVKNEGGGGKRGKIHAYPSPSVSGRERKER